MNREKYIAFFAAYCATLQLLAAQPFYEVAPLPVNTPYADEIAPAPYAGGIIFCSNRRTSVLANRTDLNNNPLYHLFFVQKKDSVKWSIPHVLYKGLDRNAQQGPSSVSASGQEIYFTFNNADGEKIYMAGMGGESWTNIRPFVHNLADTRTAHPSLSRDGKRLFFVSDMPGGYGGMDIYCCEWTPGGWGTPENTGPEVNTAGDELYPFIQENGILYFSSAGHGSMGGMDIFSVREIDGNWGFRQRLEEPVNSTYDDFAYSAADADGMDGYFTSDRNGQTFDLFSFRSLFPVFACSPQEENDYTYEFFDPATENIDLDTTSFRFEWVFSDGAVKYGQEVKHTFASTGFYTAQLNVVDTLTGETDKQAAFLELEVLDIEQPYITVTGTPEAGKSLSFDASKTYLPETDIEGYYWTFSDGTRIKGEYVEHTFVAPGIYRVQLGVTGKNRETGETEKPCSSLEITVE